jgi:hypothetical protein
MKHDKALRGGEGVVYAETGRDRVIPVASSDILRAHCFAAIVFKHRYGRVPATLSIVRVGQAPEELGEEGLSPPVDEVGEDNTIVVETRDARGVAHDDKYEHKRPMMFVEDGAGVVDELPEGVTATYGESLGVVGAVGLEIADSYDAAPSARFSGCFETVVWATLAA